MEEKLPANKFDESIELYKKKIRELKKKKMLSEQQKMINFSNFIITNMNNNDKFKKEIEHSFSILGKESIEYLNSIYSTQNTSKAQESEKSSSNE